MPEKLMRSNDDRMIGGVCSGLSRYFKVDPTLVRLAFVLLTIYGGVGPLVYLALLLIMPMDSEVAAAGTLIVDEER